LLLRERTCPRWDRRRCPRSGDGTENTNELAAHGRRERPATPPALTAARPRGHRLLGKRSERVIERQRGLAFLAEAADGDRAVGRFLSAAHQQRRPLWEGVPAPLVVDLLVAHIALDP